MKAYYDSDADLGVLAGKTVAIIGYGNQGRAQGMNMRDSGLSVIVGNIPDASFAQAQADGLEAMSIAEAAQRADVLCLFLPDEVQPGVYRESIAPHLRAGQALNFAHGYTIHYGLIQPPADVDVIMVAPRMIGVGVRERFLAGKGAPAFVAVQQDATGRAWAVALAIGRAIGATRAGLLASSFKEETELDHFAEQAVWPVITRLFRLAFEVLSERGYQPEVMIMDMYQSGEPSQIFQEAAAVGLFRQMAFHSRTSQYGTLSRGPLMLPDEFKDMLNQRLDDIQNGVFSREWEAEREAGFPVFNRLRAEALAHPMNEVEERLRAAVGGGEAGHEDS
jgi:ketol-acid reductoisomerase